VAPDGVAGCRDSGRTFLKVPHVPASVNGPHRYAGSSIGRAADSKSAGCGFKSLPACLLGPAQRNQEAPILGTATVDSFDADNSRIVIKAPQITNPYYTIMETKRLRVDAAAGSAIAAAASNARGIPAFDKIYVQAAGIALLILGSTLLGFWLIGVKPASSEFLIATDGEMKKVNWSTRKDIIGSTQVVIMWCVLLALGLFLVDTVFAKFFQMINVLEQ
jgi:preprotein translocase SecE subunit